MVIDTENWSVKLKSSRPQANTNSAMITTQTPLTSTVDTTLNEIDAILAKYDKLFAKSATDLGRITIKSHRILLKDDEPVAMRPYRQSFQDAQETSRQIKRPARKRFNTRIRLTSCSVSNSCPKERRKETLMPGFPPSQQEDHSGQAALAIHSRCNRQTSRQPLLL